MKAIAMIVVAAAFSAVPAPNTPTTRSARVHAAAITHSSYTPGRAASAQDPADSLYRAGREAFSRGNFTRSSDLFSRLVERYPSSANAGEAMYYLAFSMYRVGGTEKLKSARDVLGKLRTKYPKVAKGDAASLRTRICGELARRGDEDCAAEVAQVATTMERENARRDRSPRGANTVPAGCPGENDEDDERVAALNALLQMDAERAMPVLSKVLERRDPCSVNLRRKAVFLVSQKRTPETADLLLKIARNDPDQEVREQAVFWLSQVPDERAVDMLQDILRNSKDDGLQNKALFALSQHRSARGSAILREFAARDGTSEEVRGQSIFWLGQRRSGENAQFLRDLFPRLTSEELKDKVIFSLSQQRGVGNEKWMMDIVANNRESVEIRKKALFWAGQSGVALDELIPYYSRLTDHEMKDQMIFVLSQRRSTAAVDKLLDIAKNDKDAELRKKAIFWLGQSKDPRVQQFLLDLINR